MNHPSNFINLAGQRFGRLTVIDYAGRIPDRRESLWRVRCDCGTVFNVLGVNLRKGKTRSCGCLRAEMAAAKAPKASSAWCRPVRLVSRDGVRMCRSCAEAARVLDVSIYRIRTLLNSGGNYKGIIIQSIK